MKAHPRISQDPGVMVGKPVIAGTRIPVDFILRQLSGGLTTDELLEAYPTLKRDDIPAALAFAADFIATATVKVPTEAE